MIAAAGDLQALKESSWRTSTVIGSVSAGSASYCEAFFQVPLRGAGCILSMLIRGAQKAAVQSTPPNSVSSS
jgi:hypothetical protein